MAEIIDGAGRFADPGPEGTHWVEHLRSEHLSVGTYSIAAGSDDAQVPHREDEIYLVTAGTARFTSASPRRGGGARIRRLRPGRGGAPLR